MKKILKSFVLILLVQAFVLTLLTEISYAGGGTPTMNLRHYRWRNDDGDESSTGASWKQNQNTSHTGQSKNETVRLRVEIDNTGTANSGNKDFSTLQYSTNAGGNCGSGTWTTIPTSATSEHWQITTSQLTDKGSTTDNGITNHQSGYSFTAGKQVENPAAGGNYNVTVTTTQYTQLEYALTATSNATDSIPYYIRVTDAGAALNGTYSQCPTITMAAGGITVSGSTNVSSGTVAIAVNGSSTGQTGSISSGTWSVSGITTPANGANIIAYISGAATADESSAVVTYSGSGNVTGMVLNQHTLTVGSSNQDSSTTITALINDYDYDDNNDIIFRATGSTLTVDPGGLYTDESISILSGDTFTIATSETLTTGSISNSGTLTASGSATINVSNSFTNSGTFNSNSSTVNFNGDATISTLTSGSITFNNLVLNPTITGNRSYTFGSTAHTVNGNFTINPTAASSLTLTVNMGANITVASTGTTTITGTTSGLSVLDTRPASTNYNLSTGFLNIGAAGTLDATGAASTITLTGTSGTLFTYSGGFNAGSSTVIFSPNAAVTLFSGSPTLFNLSLTPTITVARTYTVGAALTVNGNLTINPTAASSLLLTVNAGGHITGTATTTISITGTTSGTSTLDLRPASTDYNLTAGFLNIGTSGTLDSGGAASTITLRGTSGTLFTLGGTFTAGSSTLIMNPDAAVTLFSASTTVYNLSLTPSITTGRTYTIGAALTINGNFTINPSAGSTLTLTVNAGGNLTGTATTRVSLTGTLFGTSILDLRPASTDYNLTAGIINIDPAGTLDATGAASTITLSGTSDILFLIDGTFNEGSTTLVINSDADVTLFQQITTLYNLSLTPTITSSRIYTLGDELAINGGFTINPTAASSLILTVNASGPIIGSATSTVSLTGTTSGSSTLDLRPASTDYNLTAGFINIAAAGTLDATSAASTITLLGTSGTLFTRLGTFNEGSSTVTIQSASGTPTLNSGTVTFNNLTIDPTSSITVSTASDDITVSGTLSIASTDTLELVSGQDLTHTGSTLTLNGTISGAGRFIYTSSTAFPSTGSISSILRLDTTNGNQTLTGNRTYAGNIEIYNNSGASQRTVTMGTGASQSLTFSGNITLNANNTQSITLSGGTHNPTVAITGNLAGTSGGGAEDITTGTGTWTITGNVDFTDIGTFTSTGGTFQMNGTSKTITAAGEIFNNYAVTGGSVSNVDSLDVNGTFGVSGGATFTHGAGADIDINIGGDFTLASGTTWVENVTESSNVIFDGDLDYADNNGTKQSIGNVIVGASPDTTNLTTDFVANSLAVTAGNYFNTCEYEVDINNSDINISGIFDASASGNAGSVSPCSAGNEGDESIISTASDFIINSGATFVADASTVLMDDSTGTDVIITDGTYSLYNLTINTGGATIQVQDPLDVDNNLTITAGILDVVSGENNAITVGGNWDNDATFEARSGTVTFNATSGTKTIDADGTGTDAFYNLVFDDGGNAGTFQLTTALSVNNNLTITGGTLDTNGQNITLGGNFDNDDTLTMTSGTLTMNATTGTKTIDADGTGIDSIFNLTFNDGGNSATFQLTTSADINGDLTITGGTLDTNSQNMTVAGNWTNSDLLTAAGGTVTFDGTTSTTINSGCSDASSCTGQDFYNLEINKTSGTDANDNVTLATNHLKVLNTITITDGEFIQSTLNVQAEGAVGNAVTIASAGQWTNTSTGNLTLGNTFSNSGTATFQGNGASCGDADDITIASTAASQRSWTGSGTFNVNDVTVSYQAGDASITAFSSTDSGNNGANWTIYTGCTPPAEPGNNTFDFGGQFLLNNLNLTN